MSRAEGALDEIVDAQRRIGRKEYGVWLSFA